MSEPVDFAILDDDLGCCLAEGTLHHHGGTIHASNRAEGGASLEVRLPALCLEQDFRSDRPIGGRVPRPAPDAPVRAASNYTYFENALAMAATGKGEQHV